MRRLLFGIFVIFLMMPSANALPAVDLSTTQGVLGGYSLDLSGNMTGGSAGGSMADAPSIAEVYTATWCTNCVDAEHALMDAVENEDVTILTHHRFISETEDPFGTQAGDDRWNEFYGDASNASVGMKRAPPTIIFHGNQMKVGSVADGTSLEADYTAMLDATHEYTNSDANSEFTWTGNNSSGVIVWSMDVAGFPDTLIWEHRLMIVEHSAYFPEGSNGLEHYEDVVREVVDLEATLQENEEMVGGSVELQLPAAWDGDDLSLVLVHDWVAPGVEESVPEGGENGLPGFLAPLGLIALGSAAMARRD
jgi:hypothetical protein